MVQITTLVALPGTYEEVEQRVWINPMMIVVIRPYIGCDSRCNSYIRLLSGENLFGLESPEHILELIQTPGVRV